MCPIYGGVLLRAFRRAEEAGLDNLAYSIEEGIYAAKLKTFSERHSWSLRLRFSRGVFFFAEDL